MAATMAIAGGEYSPSRDRSSYGADNSHFCGGTALYSSDSMIPTLHTGDRLVVEKVSYWFHPAETGDIVVFEPPAQLQSMGYHKTKFLSNELSVNLGIPSA